MDRPQRVNECGGFRVNHSSRTKAGLQESFQDKSLSSRRNLSLAFVLVADLFDGGDVVKPTDGVGCSECLASFDLAPMHFLDEAHVAALVAPGLRDHFGIKRRTCQPRTWLAVAIHL